MKYIIHFNESEYNYHVGNIKDTKNIETHLSDNIIRMEGRHTGHFGSGMYFSTYKGENYNSKYGEYSSYDKINNKPDLHEVESYGNTKLYRVDFNIYKNLYRVTSEKHGDFLYKTLKIANSIFNSYENGSSKTYLILKHNLNILGLKLPNYKDFIKMIKDAKKDYEMLRSEGNVVNKSSFSTRIMEYNDYNGVNVSNVPGYDNTTHGSVIYDMSKLSDQPKKIDTSSIFFNNIKNNIIYPWDNNLVARLLNNEKLYDEQIKELNEMDFKKSNILMKRYYNWIYSFYFEKLNKNLQLSYIRTLPLKLKEDYIYNLDSIENDNIKLILTYFDNINFIYDKNVKFNKVTLLTIILDSLTNYNFEEYADKIIYGINRKLDENEQDAYDYLLNFREKYGT